MDGWRSLLGFLVSLAFFSSVSQAAILNPTLSLGEAAVDEAIKVASFDVWLDFETDSPSSEVVYFGLDVSNSSPELAPGGDFSAFSFSPSFPYVVPSPDPSFTEWNEISSFGPGLSGSVAEYETFGPGFTSSVSLGTLKVNYSSLALDGGFTVAINGFGTLIGFMDETTGFGLLTPEFLPASRTVTLTGDDDNNNGVIPEPTSLAAWSLLALVGCGYWRRRRKTTGGSEPVAAA